MAIPEKIYYQGNEYLYHALPTPGAVAHNKILRNENLGVPNDKIYASIRNGSFDDLYIGDYFVINNHKYVIAGLDYLYGAENNSGLGHHALIIDLNTSSKRLHHSNDLSKGYVDSEMFRTTLPNVLSRIKADFGNHLLSWNEYLTTSVENGYANGGDWFNVQISLPNHMMLGHVYDSLEDNFKNPNGTDYNIGIEKDALPIFSLDLKSLPKEIYGNWILTRTISVGTKEYNVNISSKGDFYTYMLNSVTNYEYIYPFFLIG